jgi:Protein of unknown function (DUF3987)
MTLHQPPPSLDPFDEGVRAADVPVAAKSDFSKVLFPEEPADVVDAATPVEPAPLAPNKTDISAHLYALFDPAFVQPYPDSWIEIAYAHPSVGDGKPNAARTFSPFKLEDAIAFAEAKNKAGFNIYIGAALRHGEPSDSGRSSSDHVLDSSHAWVEFDKEGDEARVTALLKEKGLTPALTVVTGHTPCMRAHLYFRLDGAITFDGLGNANDSLKALLGTDAVQNPDRLLRLAGTVSYPTSNKQERGYVPELVTLHHVPGWRAYRIEELTDAAPPESAGGRRGPGYSETEESPAPTKENFFKNVNQLAVVNPSRWVRALFGNNVKFYKKIGTWRTVSNKKIPGRERLEEGISISQRGVWDYGEEKASSPIDLAMAFAPQKPNMIHQVTELEAAEWLCWKMDVPKEALGWGTRESRSADDPEYEEGYASQQTSNDAEPVDLWGRFSPPSLQRGMLPDIIERYAIAQGRATGADLSGIAVATLAVCAAAIPDSIQLQVKQHNIGWRESARIWVAIIGDPSVKKTPIIKAAVFPLEKIDADYSKANSEARAEYNKLSADEKRKTTPPVQPRVVLQSVTIEAAQEIFKDNHGGLLVHNDELAGFFGSMDKYSGGGKGSATDRAFWLQSYNGGVYTSDRVGRGSTFIPNLSACILGGIQPAAIRKIAGDCVDDGLLQRFLPVVVQDSVVGTDEPMSDDVREYGEIVRALHHLQGDVTLKFDEGAQKLRLDLEHKHKELESCWSMHKKLATHIGKYDGIFARLCVLFHCIDSARGTYGFAPLPTVITEATARRAADFLHGFLFRHALAFYTDVLGLADDHDHLAAVAGYILAHGLEKLTNRDIARGDTTMRNLKRQDVDAVFDQLHAFGWIDRSPDLRPGRRTESIWTVNPRVHVEHAGRAKTEAERRSKDRKMLAEMFGKRE